MLAESECLCCKDEVDVVAGITNESKISHKLHKTYGLMSFIPCESNIKFDN